MHPSTETNGQSEEIEEKTPQQPTRKDSLTKVNEKIDEFRRNESEFLSQMRMSVSKEAPPQSVLTAEEKMKELIDQADKFASFLLSKHRMKANHCEKGDIRTSGKGKRRKSDQLETEEAFLMKYVSA